MPEFEERGVTLVAVSVDAADETKTLVEKLGLTFPVLSDTELLAARAWGVEDGENGISWPAIFVVGREGKIAWRSLSETYKVRETPAAILDALDVLKSATAR